MTQAASAGSTDRPSVITHEAYSQSGNEQFETFLRCRTAATSAVFFFDAAFAHMLFIHLSTPVPALQELWRVLKPGGVVGLRDVDEGGTVLAPASSLLEQARALELRILQHHGGDPFVGRQHRRLLSEAGFASSVGEAPTYAGGTAEATQRYAANWRGRFESATHIGTAIEEGC